MSRTPRWLSAATLAAVVALSGCDDGTRPVPSGVVGSYALVAVNGKSLPAPLVSQPGQPVTVVQGNLILEGDGEYFQIIETRQVDESGGAHRGINQTEGEFSVAGGRIELREKPDGRTRNGNVNGGNVRYSIGSGASVLTLDWRK